MVKLTLEELKKRSEWAEAGIGIPTFDIEKMKEETKAHPRWVHVGPGNIFRGFIADLADRLLESGEWQLSDEYGNAFEPGDESVEKLEDLCSWVGGGRFEGKTPKRYEGVNDYKSDRPLIPSHHYRDPQGFCFDSEEFS